MARRPPHLIERTDTLHARIRESNLAQRFTLLVRTALAAAFIAPGLTKVFGIEFAPGLTGGSLMADYFAAFHAVGPYYAFVGAAQVVSGALLLFRRTALLGAVLYFPAVLNIAVLTVATRFGVGTPTITVLMTLGCLWLLLWDGHRLAPVLAPRLRSIPGRIRERAVWDALTPSGASVLPLRTIRGGYVAGLSGLVGFTLAARGLLPEWVLLGGLSAVVAGALLTVGGWGVHGFRSGATRSAAGPAGAGRSL